MFHNMGNMHRRQFLGRALTLAAGAAAATLPSARSVAAPAPAPVLPVGLTAGLLPMALGAFHRNDVRITERRIMGVADFSIHSATPRFHLINVENGQSEALLVAHGRGSDPDHSGMLQNFSNVPGSEATSSGAYLVGESYVGKYGLSRRLIGLDGENNLAEPRAIVIHPAWYVSQSMIAEHGRIGRSQGCFAFSDADIAKVLWQCPPGSLIYAGKI
jgi:L,D-transpeptidase catalytic domain